MGEQRAFSRGKNDFYEYLYTSLSARITRNGVTGRMIVDKRDLKGEHSHLPAYSKTCDLYFYPGANGLAKQAKLYRKGRMVLDFDWDHPHHNIRKNGEGESFPIGVIHVQEYVVTKIRNPKTGKFIDKFIRRSNNARLMTEAEIEKYGELIHYFNPYVKFRP